MAEPIALVDMDNTIADYVGGLEPSQEQLRNFLRAVKPDDLE